MINVVKMCSICKQYDLCVCVCLFVNAYSICDYVGLKGRLTTYRTNTL